MSGFIKLHRGWHDSAQFANEPYCERAAWCWLLTNAAWKPTTQRNHRGEVVHVDRGQFHTSFRALASEWNWSIKRVRTFLKVLEKCAAIGTHGAQGGTLLTICKYKEYQENGHASGTIEGTHGARTGHTKEEGKEDKEEKKEDTCPSGDGPTLKPEHVMEAWNASAPRLGKPSIRTLTPERRQLIKARIGQYSLDDFQEVFGKIERSAFLRGDTGWRGCTFDWVFKKTNFQKIIEGNYDQ